MPKSLKLLLVENVDSLGIVGDVVTVRTGYARNFLLPRSLATTPSDDLIKQLAGKREQAQKQLAALRKEREATTEKLKGVEIELVRSCNDMGILYGAVTQQDIATALHAKGFKTVVARDVRIAQTIKRVDNFDIHVKLDKDLDAIVKLHVKPDRELTKDRSDDKPKDAKEAAPQLDAEGKPIPVDPNAPKPAEGAKQERGDRPERPRRDREDREDRGDRFSKRRDVVGAALEEASKSAGMKTGWGSGSSDKKADAASGDEKPAKKGEAKGEKGAKGEKAEKGAKKK